MESFATALVRQLHQSHPVYKLLYPHLQYIIQINTFTRTDFINPGGLLDQILSIGGGSHMVYNKVKEIYIKQNMTFLTFNLELIFIFENTGIELYQENLRHF